MGSDSSNLSGLDPGRFLAGRYKITGELSRGGFSQTFLAEDLHLPGRPLCVVKQLKPKSDDTRILQTSRRLFETEAKVLEKLGRHDQIPSLLAYFEEDREFYLVLELIRGESLTKELKPGRIWPELKVIAFLQDLLSILKFVHQQNVIHRDIKPSNLIRRHRDGKIVLIDFGAVKQTTSQIADPESNPTVTITIGTHGYMPNEQLAGHPRFSSDIYAVGMIGIQALTGIKPRELGHNLQTGEVKWRQDAMNVDEELALILEQMVRYHFKDRYPTATEALQAIDDLTSSLSLAAEAAIHFDEADYLHEGIKPNEADKLDEAISQHEASYTSYRPLSSLGEPQETQYYSPENDFFEENKLEETPQASSLSPASPSASEEAFNSPPPNHLIAQPYPNVEAEEGNEELDSSIQPVIPSENITYYQQTEDEQTSEEIDSSIRPTIVSMELTHSQPIETEQANEEINSANQPTILSNQLSNSQPIEAEQASQEIISANQPTILSKGTSEEINSANQPTILSRESSTEEEGVRENLNNSTQPTLLPKTILNHHPRPWEDNFEELNRSAQPPIPPVSSAKNSDQALLREESVSAPKEGDVENLNQPNPSSVLPREDSNLLPIQEEEDAEHSNRLTSPPLSPEESAHEQFPDATPPNYFSPHQPLQENTWRRLKRSLQAYLLERSSRVPSLPWRLSIPTIIRSAPLPLILGVGLLTVAALVSLSSLIHLNPRPINITARLAALPCQEPPPPPLPSGGPDYIAPNGLLEYYGPLKADNTFADGRVIMVFPNSGDRYDGELKNGKRNGCGTLIFGWGRYYEGQFKNDQFHGQGIWTLENGNRYIGSFRKGKCQGQGIFIFATGRVKQGHWSNGRLRWSNLTCD